MPISGEAARRMLRTTAVAALTVVTLGLSLPNLLLAADPQAHGVFDFYTNANVVVYAGRHSKAAGIAPGDRIDYSRMPPTLRYGHPQDGLREPAVGKTISFVVDRGGVRHTVTLRSLGIDWDGDWAARFLLLLVAQKAVFLVLVLLASALILIRPTQLTSSFFLFVAGNGVMPFGYSFLPVWAYAVIMVANDALAGLGAIGFLGLALYLDPRRQTRTRVAMGIAAALLAAIVVPIATSDALELTFGVRPAWPIAGWASFSVLSFCFAAGVVLLLRVTLDGEATRSLRLLAALLAAVGAVTILSWTLSAYHGTWYFANLPGVAMNRGVIVDRAYPPWLYIWMGTDTLFILRLLGALLAFYVIIRAGVANAGPVFRRIVASIIVALLVVAVLFLANIALMPRFAGYAPIVPLEILAAVAIGYWVSGLRDLAGCLSRACVDASSAWANGRAQEERDALVQSLGLAERTRRPSIIAEVRAHIAFSSWRNGEDGAFEQKIDALQRVIRGRSMRGVRGFALAATSDEHAASFEPDDLPEWKARAALVLCARTDDARRAQRLAVDALAEANRAGLPSLQVLASVAVAETCGERRDALLERANVIARDANWPALSKSVLALRANARDIGVLQSFVDIRLRKCRPARSMFHVSFFNAELRVDGQPVPLTEKQLEMLLTVASAPSGINDNDLLDALWAEAEGDAARNSLRVCLHGLRKNAGDMRIVTRVGKAFVLHQWADVDLWRFQSLLSVCRGSGGVDHAGELQRMACALRSGEGRRATLGGWFFRFEQMLNRKLDEAERSLARDVANRARS